MTVYGYARVSTYDQKMDMQIIALEKAGCERVFKDHGISGVSDKRQALSQLLATVEAGDEVVVWRLDRLARSMFELVNIVQELHGRGVMFRSICEYIDVNSAFGELVLHILGAIAHFERALIVERTRAGMLAAQQRGVKFGRRPALDDDGLSEIMAAIADGRSITAIARDIGVGRSTIYRYLAETRDDIALQKAA